MVRPHVFPAMLVCYSLVAQAPNPGPGVQQLSLQEAIKVSLQNNLQVEIAKENRTSIQSGLLQAEGSFDWNLNAGLSLGRQEGETTSLSNYAPGQTTTTDSTSWRRNLTVGTSKAFGWGGNLSLNYNPVYSYVKSTTPNGLLDANGVVIGDSHFATSYPYTGTFSATYNQHLLNGWGRDVNELGIIVARKQNQSADLNFQLTIINLVASTESQYWDLVYAQRNLENAKLALELAQKSLNENRTKVEVGTMAPIEVTSAEAAVAQQQQVIILAEAQLANASDALIRTLYPNSQRPEKLIPSDAPTLSHIQVDEPTAEKMAVDNRLELRVNKLDLETKAAQRTAAENRLKPTLDAFVTYNGNTNNYTGISSVNSDISGFKLPGYVVGLNFSMPIGNRAAKGSLAQARANERASQLSMKDEELAILLEVRQAYRNVDASEKGVEATKKTREYREKDLEAEQKKFENGMSTNFFVLSKQNDLDTARSQELQAQITYAKSVTSLERAVGNLMNARKLAFPK